MQLSCVVLTAVFALAAAPALAAVHCDEPGPTPSGATLPDPPIKPLGVTSEMVGICTEMGVHSYPAQCSEPPAAPYLKALAAWTAEATAFDSNARIWRIKAERYSACVDAALQLTPPKPAGAP
jgi:hypothetical protein